MALFKFLHTPKPRQYTYVPRYYDAKKEDLEERLRKARQTGDPDDPEGMKLRISQGFKQKFRQDQKFKRKMRRNSNMRLAITIVVLFFVAYFLVIRFLPQIENFLR